MCLLLCVQVDVCGYPLSIFFIVVNEFCERFSYYGMRAVLVLYFRYFLKWDDDLATSIYHTFIALCYLTPILGAIVADSWLGKFKTIVYLSIVYTVGQVVMAVSAIHDITDTDRDGTPDNMTFHVAMSMVGLFLIALGTGGIKPCVAAFGGDQFEDHQEKQRSTFFSIFYLSINAGSLLSTVITPILRGQECGIHSQQKCYPLAFGVPAALMVVALIVFIMGSGMYNKTAPKGNIMLEVCKCIGFAIKNRFRHRSKTFPKREHWMDWADEKYDKLLVAQVKMVLKVLFLYIPLPMFWTLFDQQGSRWTLQATTMDGNFVRTVNPILILALVPIMDSLVYPLIKKCHLNFTPLKRMTVGMLIAALAFVAAALLQLQIDVSMYIYTHTYTPHTHTPPTHIHPPHTYTLLQLQIDQCAVSDCVVKAHVGLFTRVLLHVFLFAVSDCVVKAHVGLFTRVLLHVFLFAVSDCVVKAHVGLFTRVLLHVFLCAVSDCVVKAHVGLFTRVLLHVFLLFAVYSFCSNSVSCVDYCVQCWQAIQVVEDIKPNTIHMGWQIPQYFLMTAGEVVFSVTGLEFSYSQAPSNMKSVLQAGWLFTVAVGNIIVLIVAEAAQLPDQWAEYILFASLLVVVCIVFAVMSYFYTYTDPAEIEAQFRQPEHEPEEKKRDRQTTLFCNEKESFFWTKSDRSIPV
uniref:Solute carrier family 15 member 1 n=1 Tax=Oncorhynchus kisutch TaxID=8019 RepID=A0A8C7LKL7_ONCKI